MAVSANDRLVTAQEGVAHRVEQRRVNRERAASASLSADAQGLVELACECSTTDCERSVKVPLYVYQRMLEAGDQYLLQAGHHAFTQYRTIVSLGLTRIEERV